MTRDRIKSSRRGKAAAPAPTEMDILHQVIEAAALFGVTLERQNTGVGSYENKDGSERRVRYGKAGNLDLRGSLPIASSDAGTIARTIEVEIKRPGRKPTDAQWDRIHTLNAAGGVAFYVTDAEQVTRVLPRLLAGWRVDIDVNGNQFITDEPPSGVLP